MSADESAQDSCQTARRPDWIPDILERVFDPVASRTARLQGYRQGKRCTVIAILSPLIADEPTWERPLAELRPWNDVDLQAN